MDEVMPDDLGGRQDVEVELANREKLRGLD